MMEPVVLPGVVRLEPDPLRPGLVSCTFLSGPPLTVTVPRARVQEIFDWWLAIAPEVAVDGYLQEEALEQFRDDIVVASVPDDLSGL
ncbi:hypothetical protein [Kineosporia succinea]|uniref:Uncharacterized protein n=1 Tax=Kineosporia succinea TaxID=84632 RepID=A0ABT9PCU0_9ACTN|nr:hypothetical protein [Kineosporia succinea]MDP9830515.1 hypothetical protein [Kineosporia succinea]